MALDSGMMAALADAGLADPNTGAITSQPNFGGKPEFAASLWSDVDTDDDRRGNQETAQNKGESKTGTEPAEETQPEQQSPASEPNQPQQDLPVLPQNEPIHPEKVGDVQDPTRQYFDNGRANLQRAAEVAYYRGLSAVDGEGKRLYTDQQVAQTVLEEYQRQEQQLWLDAVMRKMEPVAVRAHAENVAKQYGIDVKDIEKETSPQAMEVRARTLSEVRRDKNYQNRKESGADQAEGSRGVSNAIPASIDKLSPQGKIYLGLARGDR